MSKKHIKLCPLPFSRMVAGKSGFVPCCSEWLSPQIYPAQTQMADPWNSVSAQMLREKILAGDYSLCRRDLCMQPLATLDELKKAPDFSIDAPLSMEALRAIEEGQTVLDYGPLAVSVSADPRCNLSCPSCRTDYIFRLDDSMLHKMAATELVLRRYQKTITIVRLSGNGEVFFSPWLRALLQSFERSSYPALKRIDILSNGLLFNQKSLSELRPGSDLIKRVCITIDAGDEETYAKVRGGDWSKLIRNLEWMASLRKAKRFESLVLQLIVQQKNYTSIPKLIDLARGLEVDLVNLYEVYDWSKALDYNFAAVHLKSHPEYDALMNVLAPFRNDPLIRISTSLGDPGASGQYSKGFSVFE